MLGSKGANPNPGTSLDPKITLTLTLNLGLTLTLTKTLIGNEGLDFTPNSTTAQHSVVTVSRTVGLGDDLI